ncbi:MAG: hypothetical protein IJY12_01380 [Clostridia bacterium]|nr:hypothetical protein [Clostridia bacterium]
MAKTRIIVEQIKTEISASDEAIFALARKRIKASGFFSEPQNPVINRRSIDARNRDEVHFVSSVAAEVEQKGNTPASEALLKKFGIKYMSGWDLDLSYSKTWQKERPVVVGFGPAGMFCALILARCGLKPLVLERGGDVDSRVASVDRFYRDRILDTNSNIQFGAGGAGTFSDGKLTTRINDPKCAFVLKILADMGAPADIVYRAKPHVGTDILRTVVKNMAAEITRLGGEIRYNTRAVSFENGRLVTDSFETIPYGVLVLALGHSARDTYGYLIGQGFSVMAKPFSVGVRVEHLQEEIDAALLGKFAGDPRLGHAEYAVSHRLGEKGVYSFCMCPGGEVVAAASEENTVVVNGMSRYARDGVNANSAIAVSVDRNDYGNDPRLAIEFQRSLERAAFAAGGGRYVAPVQTLGDFYRGEATHEPKRIMPSYMDGDCRVADLNRILPDFVSNGLKAGFAAFGRRISGFDAPDVPITGVETRTSAPLRILRDESYTCPGRPDIYPCGEGAGYAGGITSAAVDGIAVALAILNNHLR